MQTRRPEPLSSCLRRRPPCMAFKTLPEQADASAAVQKADQKKHHSIGRLSTLRRPHTRPIKLPSRRNRHGKTSSALLLTGSIARAPAGAALSPLLMNMSGTSLHQSQTASHGLAMMADAGCGQWWHSSSPDWREIDVDGADDGRATRLGTKALHSPKHCEKLRQTWGVTATHAVVGPNPC